MDSVTITPTAILNLTNGGTLAVWREQVSYVRGRGRDGATVTVDGLEFDVIESIGQVYGALHC